jgi:hypothetical protein
MRLFKAPLLLIIIQLFLFNQVIAQDADKTVTLTVTGQGKTIDEAKTNALRSAIEQAFGVFISSNTTILNDKLIKDEIVSVSNGNIQKYDVLNELRLSDGGYATTLKTIVSIGKLTNFCESKGVKAEFNGSLFAYNILLQELNEKNEINELIKVCEICKKISLQAFDYKITVKEPIINDKNNKLWAVPIKVDAIVNNNFSNISFLLYNTLNGLSLKEDEVYNYKKLNKKVYPVNLAVDKTKYGLFILRTNESYQLLLDLIYSFNNSISNFKINNDVAIIDNKILLKNNNQEKDSRGPEPEIKEEYWYWIEEKFSLILKIEQVWDNVKWYVPSLFIIKAGRGRYLDQLQHMSFQDLKYQQKNYQQKYYEEITKEYTFNYKDFIKSDIDRFTINRHPQEMLEDRDYHKKNFEGLFSFVNSFESTASQEGDSMEHNHGLIISFQDFYLNNNICSFYFPDERTLEELKKIKGYTISSNKTN